MYALIRKLSLIAIACVAPALMQAQTAPKIAVVDIAKIYDNHWLTQEQNEKLKGDEAKANDELTKMMNEGNSMVEKFHALEEQAKSPTLTAEAKTKLQTEAQTLYNDIQQKQQTVNTYRSSTTQTLDQRIQTFRTLMLEQIVTAVNKVGKTKGFNLILDKSGPSAIGVPALIFADDSFDITQDVMNEINKDKPATVTPPSPAAAAAKTAAPTAPPAAPLTVPGVKK